MKFPAKVETFEAVDLGPHPLSLAIGMFDGVHLGHQAVIESAIHSAARSGGISGALTFWPHPRRVIHPQKPTYLLMPPENKVLVLHRLGVDLVIEKPFTEEFAALQAEQFVPFLKKALPTLKSLHVGENYRFGRDRKGDMTSLLRQAQALGIDVFSAKRIKHNGEDISSTRIRHDLQAGRIEEANALLGYTYFSHGPIQPGEQRGRRLGFPTLNIPWQPELQPRYGVYVVKVTPNQSDRQIPGVANYGVRPTFSDDLSPLLEVHLMEESSLGPGDPITVAWHAFLRPEEKFSDEALLQAQIARDKARAREILGRVVWP